MKIFGRHHHNCANPWADAPPWAMELRDILVLVLSTQEAIMATVAENLDAAEASAKANADAEDSIIVILTAVKAEVDALRAAGTDPATANRIQALAQALATRTPVLAAAAVAGTPAA